MTNLVVISKSSYLFFLAIILTGYSVLQISFVAQLPLTYDESVNLLVSQLIVRGYTPYGQIFTLVSPLFIWFIGWLGNFNLSPTEFKLAFLPFGLLLLVNTSIIARTLLGREVALTAVFLLATATTFLAEAATAIVGVTWALSIATLSLVFILRYWANKRLRWMFLGGVAWGVALFLSTSMLSIGLVPIILLIFFNSNQYPSQTSPNRFWAYILYSAQTISPNKNIARNNIFTWPNFFRPILIWLLGTLLFLGIGLFLATSDIIFNHLLNDYLTIRENLPITPESNFILIGQFIFLNLWLFLFAAYGVARIYEDKNHPLWLVLIWSLLSFCWLILQVTVRMVDVTILLPPLAIMAGWGVIDLGCRLIRWSQNWQMTSSKQRLFLSALIVLLLGMYIGVTWQQIRVYNLSNIHTPGELTQLEQRPEIVAFIQQHSTSNDCVIIDDAALAIAASRAPAPELVELTEERIASGLITEQTIAKLAQEYACKVVVFSKREYTQPLSKFRDWAQTYYPNEQEFARTTIYYR